MVYQSAAFRKKTGCPTRRFFPEYKAWLAENQDYFESILRVAEFPDRSTKGIALNRLTTESAKLAREFAMILRSSARLALEGGDQDAALRYFKASTGLADHFADIEVTSVLSGALSSMIRADARDSFRDNFLESLASDPRTLKSWQEAVFRDETPASQYARMVTGEWNTSLLSIVLPRLLGDASGNSDEIRIGDATTLLDSYTTVMRKLANEASHQAPGRFHLSDAAFETPSNELNPDNANILGMALDGFKGFTRGFETNATADSMQSAAIAIKLGNEPAMDPVSGKAFQWNPETRVLSPPIGVESVDPIKIP